VGASRRTAPPSLLDVIRKAVDSSGHAGKWRVPDEDRPDRDWIELAHVEASMPDQGWKLHLTASETSALDVLAGALNSLLDEPVTFKVTRSLAQLNDLNEGHGGLSQVGKFLTVYPNDDAQALRLCASLDKATRGLRGPRIRSDRALRRGSIVHYRYGGFAGLFLQTPMGQILPALRDGDGELIPDERKPTYLAPHWLPDPFLAAGLADPPKPRGRLLGGRYLVVATLHESPRGSIFSAVDVRDPRACIIKHAERNALPGRRGQDACGRLRHEMAVLARLDGDDRFPQVLDLFEEEDDAYLVMTEIAGQTLEQQVRAMAAEGRLPSNALIVSWGRQAAAAVGALHRLGLVYRDLKSPNVMIDDDGRLRIVDLEMACEIGSPDFEGRGTRGYLSPRQERDRAPSVADDVYGLGAILYFAATGAEPSMAPRPARLLDRPLELMNPDLHPHLASVIRRCLDRRPRHRYASMAAVGEALAEAAAARPAAAAGPARAGPVLPGARAARRLAGALGDALCDDARLDSDGSPFWVSRHEVHEGIRARDLSIGSAGPILVLSDLVAELERPRHRDVLERAARALARDGEERPRPLPGLFVGEAGVGAALLRAGKVLCDDALVAAAADRARLIASLPYRSPDLFNGTAGRLRFHLWLWDATADPGQLAFATEAGLALLASAQGSKRAGTWWTIPDGFGGLSGMTYLGYAHGAAGIADALLDLFEATGDERFSAAARGAGRWIARHAVGSPGNGSALDWPDQPGGSGIGPYWCHGAAGIGQFLLHAAELDLLPEARALAGGAALAAARSARWSGPTQCHGLAGNMEFLLDMFQSTGEDCYLAEARLLARLLLAFSSRSGGAVRWPSESPTMFTPDYTVGYAGVASCLLRLGAPKRIPRQLSRRGFAWCGRAAGCP
jgi:hypothetical protein